MKTCTKCLIEKEFSEYHKRTKSASGYAERCKKCAGEATTRWYRDNRELRKMQSTIRANKMREDARAIKTARGCAMCPETEGVCLDWHHLDPMTKDYELADIASRSWSTFLKEAEKCVVLCSNCHRKVHAGKIILR